MRELNAKVLAAVDNPTEESLAERDALLRRALARDFTGAQGRGMAVHGDLFAELKSKIFHQNGPGGRVHYSVLDMCEQVLL